MMNVGMNTAVTIAPPRANRTQLRSESRRPRYHTLMKVENAPAAMPPITPARKANWTMPCNPVESSPPPRKSRKVIPTTRVPANQPTPQTKALPSTARRRLRRSPATMHLVVQLHDAVGKLLDTEQAERHVAMSPRKQRDPVPDEDRHHGQNEL